MATAGEKFFKALTNGELKALERIVGSRMQDWEEDASGLDVNAATLIIASKRNGKVVTVAQTDEMTPTDTQAAVEAALEALGFVDDEDVDEAFLASTSTESKKPTPRKRQPSA